MGISKTFSRRLMDRCGGISSHLCVGFDPRMDRIPQEFFPGSHLDLSPESKVQAIENFGYALIELSASSCAAIKFQSAFFELYGAIGLAAMDNLAHHASGAGMVVIADVKRGDIGSTAEAYAEACLGTLDRPSPYDAITVNPWFGSDGLFPFFRRAQALGKGVFVLVRTSNPSSAEILELRVTEESGRESRVFERVADLVQRWGADFRSPHESSSLVGAVVGATHAEELKELRSRMPSTWFLVPGVGAQGATMADAAHAFDSEKTGALIALSRGITEPWGSRPCPSDWREQITSAIKTWVLDLQAAREEL